MTELSRYYLTQEWERLSMSEQFKYSNSILNRHQGKERYIAQRQLEIEAKQSRLLSKYNTLQFFGNGNNRPTKSGKILKS